MLKKAFLSAMIVTLMLVIPVQASLDPVDGVTPWVKEFDGVGHPTTDWGWAMTGSNYHQYNSRLGDGNPVGGTPGWMIATGNPGNYWSNVDNGVSQAAGWTFEYVKSSNYGQTGLIEEARIHDGSWISLGWDADPDGDNNTDDGYVQIWDRYWNVPLASAPLTIWDGSALGNEITYRLVRQPGSATVELYINNDFSSPYLQLAPLAVGGGSGSYGIQVVGNSVNEGNVSSFAYHYGATIPEPATMLVLAIGAGLALLSRRR
jgi:hypothetical protein